MIKQLRKVGNSHALILDKPLLELLGLKEQSTVQLTVSNGSLVVTPVNPATIDDAIFGKSLDAVMKRRKRLLRRLSQ